MKNIYLITFLSLSSVVLTGCNSTMTNFNGDVIKVLTDGEWNWASNKDTCNKEIQTIEVNDSKTLMTMKWKDLQGEIIGESYVYNIHKISNSQLMVDMIGEKRKSKANEIVSWNLIIKSPKLYCWHRTDWPELSCTQDMYNCN